MVSTCHQRAVSLAEQLTIDGAPLTTTSPTIVIKVVCVDIDGAEVVAFRIGYT